MMPKYTVSLKLFGELGCTVWFICDTRLITVDHQIPIDCSTFLRASRASIHDVSAIRKLIKIFLLTRNWFIVLQVLGSYHYMLLLVGLNTGNAVSTTYIYVRMYLHTCIRSYLKKWRSPGIHMYICTHIFIT